MKKRRREELLFLTDFTWPYHIFPFFGIFYWPQKEQVHVEEQTMVVKRRASKIEYICTAIAYRQCVIAVKAQSWSDKGELPRRARQREERGATTLQVCRRVSIFPFWSRALGYSPLGLIYFLLLSSFFYLCISYTITEVVIFLFGSGQRTTSLVELIWTRHCCSIFRRKWIFFKRRRSN